MSVIIALAALALLMLAAYRGYSVILFAPIAALGAVLLTDPGAVGPAFTGLFMEKMVGFVKLYFPVFLLGAVFGKLIELSGFSRSIVAAAIRILAPPRDPGDRAGLRPADLRRGVAVCGGLCRLPFRRRTISPERDPQTADPRHRRPRGILVYHGRPARHAADPEYYSHQFLRHQRLAAPWLGLIGSLFIIIFGLLWLERQRRKAQASGEGYGTDLQNEPETPDDIDLPHPLIAIAPLLLVGVLNLLFTHWIRSGTAPAMSSTCRARRSLSSPKWGKSPPSGRCRRRCSPALCWCWFAAIAISAAGWRREVGRRWAGYSRGDEHRL